jgi:hypothetical protein
MTRTTRRDYRGRPIRDGQHGRRCPEPNCTTCAASRTRDKVPAVDPKESIMTALVFLDTETLGLNLSDPIWEIAAIHREADQLRAWLKEDS